jgi:hypothetical protein
MKKFIFIMQHQPTTEQLTAASEGGREIVQIADKKLLVVPDDANLDRHFFEKRADEILAAVGGVSEGDVAHIMGQAQLAAATQAAARKAGATLVESVTPRTSKDVPQADGSVKKESVFTFSGFRLVHSY